MEIFRMDSLGPRTPGIVVSLLCCAAAVLLWPEILARFFSLDWKIGNLRPLAYSLQAMFCLLTALSLAAQNAINRLYKKVFPTGKKLLFSVFAIMLSVCFSLLALELGLRLLHLPFTERRSVSENQLAQFDPELGWTYIPNLSVVQTFGSDYRRVPIYFDSYGSRVRAPGVQRDPAAPSLLIVGCSFAFGHGLPYEETFASRLESTPGFPLQVVNLGVQAYGTDQALLRLKREFKHFNTRVVVYVYIDDTDSRN